MKPAITSRLESDRDKASPKVTELIDRKPGILIRWGVLLLIVIFLAIITIAWHIDYPIITTVKGTLIITNNSCYVQVISPKSFFLGVKRQQEVLITFENYPKTDFGTVKGIVDKLSNIGDNTICEISLPDGLKTSNETSLPALDGLLVEIRLINGKKRLVKIIFE